MPILSLGIAPLVALALTHAGLTAAYLTLAGLSAVAILAAIFVIDFPPNAADPAGMTVATEAAQAISIRDVLLTGRFWGLAIAFAAITTGASTLSAHVVPLATGWGMSATRAATLISISSIGAMIGAPVWGWIADRLGGALALAILCGSNAILWSLLLLQPPYVAMAAIMCLMGFSSAAIVAVISMALSQLFGRPSFSRAFGMCYFVSLPFMVGGVPTAAHVYVRTGSYVAAIVGMAAFSLLGVMGGLIGRTGKPSKIATLREPRHA
jgi:MFS family permease